ncbi:MAG: UDP-N-acetylmuramoyl-L-alanyl-D-glutamate--2,6-diaminopimelate ligase [Candidatus Obscuribacterales bacterium]|nr:UDP-N-acetylmuramoyl-L-alanyl-D-glutamate--2,6-diaminopimelate ligase [Candidatus Obscuribacterales bacterium]
MPELSHDLIKELAKRLNGELCGANEGLSVSRLIYDSRKVVPGSAFFCIPGERTDGNQYVADAIKSGASLIVTEQKQDISSPILIVNDVRQALADFADALYDHPSKNIRLIGVTGTNGKTTTTHLIERILNKAGNRAGLIGTLGFRTPDFSEMQEAKHTTPQAPELQEMLTSMLGSKCSHVTMEVSSHSLALKRVAGCNFAIAILSNITQDHLDFHKTMDHYWRSKRILFESLNESCQPNKLALVNLDDHLANEFLAVCNSSVRKLTYGFSEAADIQVVSHEWREGRNHIKLATPYGEMSFSMRLAGKFNIYNVMAAIGACLHEGISKEQIVQTLTEFDGVPGRFETVSIGAHGEPLCIVDYAHTPDGLENVLRTAAGIRKDGSKLICVFGCGGDRDPSKRPQMGEIAENLADFVFVTSDNPRTENPQEIIAHILTGIKRMKNVEVEADRAKAIKMAVAQAKPGDIVLVAGKGHEDYQLIMNEVFPFDDRIEVRKALESTLGAGRS